MIKVIRRSGQPIKLIRQAGGVVKVIKPSSQPVRLIKEGGTVNIYADGAQTAATLPIATQLNLYYQLKKQS